MKKLFNISFLLILGISILSSCAKKTTPPAAPTYSMSATFGSTNWSASTVTGQNYAGSLIIGGIGANNSTVSMSMPANTTAGTYNIDSTTTTYSITYSDGSNSYSMTKGSLVITSNANSVISGTFSGTMSVFGSATTLAATKGAFNVQYH